MRLVLEPEYHISCLVGGGVFSFLSSANAARYPVPGLVGVFMGYHSGDGCRVLVFNPRKSRPNSELNFVAVFGFCDEYM